MSVTYLCTNAQCSQPLQVPDHLVGKRVQCPACGQVQMLATLADRAAKGLPVAQKVTPPALTNPEELEEDIQYAVPVEGSDSQPRDSSPYPGSQRGRRARAVELGCPYCGTVISTAKMECPECEENLDAESLRAEQDRLQKQRFWSQILSFVFGLPGLGLIIVGLVQRPLPHAPFSMLAGGALLWVGIGFGVAYKRDNLAWVLLGLLTWIGLIIVAGLSDEKGKRLERIRALLRNR